MVHPLQDPEHDFVILLAYHDRALFKRIRYKPYLWRYVVDLCARLATFDGSQLWKEGFVVLWTVPYIRGHVG